MKRGVTTIEALRARSVFDPHTFCWHWQGAKAPDGVPRIWTFDHARGDKRVLSGPKAVWNIAHGRAPHGLAFRRCGCTDCVNPAHHGEAPDKAAIGLHIRRAGWRKGTHVEARTANLVHAHAANGITPTPAPIVAEILTADERETNRSIARRLNLSDQVVSTIRRGLSRRNVITMKEAA